MDIKNLPTLKINKLKSREQYNRAYVAGNINDDEIYLVPDEGVTLTAADKAEIVELVIQELGPILGTCTFTRNFTYCSFDTGSQNFITSIVKGAKFSGNISANTGYVISSISVTMGGEDITDSVVSGSNINIQRVTGDIVITAIATK